MSQERMEWARQVADAWERGDMEAVEALIEGHVEPDAELDPLYLDRVYTADEARQLWADMSETWEDYLQDRGDH
jgi:hypothetical protein